MSRNTEATDDVKTWTGGPLNYKEGFFTQLATDELAKGINEEVVRAISAKRNEPEWMLEFRLNAYRAWLEMEEPHWLKAHYDKLNYQDYSYYSAPSCGNCDDTCASEPGAVQQTGANAFLSKEVEAAFEQLGVPVREGKEVAVDAIFDSVSVATTYREKLAEQGIIFCSFGEAIHDHPELVRKYLGTVVPGNDNFFALTRKKPGSLSAPFWWPTKTATSATLKAVPLRCVTAISYTRQWWKSSSIKTPR